MSKRLGLNEEQNLRVEYRVLSRQINIYARYAPLDNAEHWMTARMNELTQRLIEVNARLKEIESERPH